MGTLLLVSELFYINSAHTNQATRSSVRNSILTQRKALSTLWAIASKPNRHLAHPAMCPSIIGN